MRKDNVSNQDNVFANMKHFIKATDIRVLVFGPPIIGFGALFAWVFLMVRLTGENINPSLSYIAIGIAALITSFSGFAEIYRREMPGPFGQILRGKIAVVSGLLIALVFGVSGSWMLIRGLIAFLAT